MLSRGSEATDVTACDKGKQLGFGLTTEGDHVQSTRRTSPNT